VIQRCGVQIAPLSRMRHHHITLNIGGKRNE
jgi:hypothetical protein